jgi:hypothetical protein
VVCAVHLFPHYSILLPNLKVFYCWALERIKTVDHLFYTGPTTAIQMSGSRASCSCGSVFSWRRSSSWRPPPADAGGPPRVAQPPLERRHWTSSSCLRKTSGTVLYCCQVHIFSLLSAFSSYICK